MEKSHYKNDAKSIVDLVFDSKLFKDDVTRDDINDLEGFVEFLLSSKFESYKRLQKFTERLNNIKKT